MIGVPCTGLTKRRRGPALLRWPALPRPHRRSLRTYCWRTPAQAQRLRLLTLAPVTFAGLARDSARSLARPTTLRPRYACRRAAASFQQQDGFRVQGSLGNQAQLFRWVHALATLLLVLYPQLFLSCPTAPWRCAWQTPPPGPRPSAASTTPRSPTLPSTLPSTCGTPGPQA